MKSIEVSAEENYSIHIGDQWVDPLLNMIKNRVRVAIIVSSTFKPNLELLNKAEPEIHVFEIPDGEAGKKPEVLFSLWNWLGAAGFTRSDLIVGIGGGAVTDVSGFAAATWLRGIDWIAVPTSLAGMVDASIGGKTGINSDYGKNLIGSFHSPREVVIDINFLDSLSPRDFSAGMAEVIKCGFISDPQILDLVKGISIENPLHDSALLIEIIARAVQVKASVVSADFKESYHREILNYGHTLGHAIESHSKYSLRHGEAVAIGMVFVAELAKARNLINQQVVDLHREILQMFNLPISYKGDAWQQLVPLLSLDKKARGKQIRFVVLNDIGSTVRLEDLNSEELFQAYERICS